jgi:hypothetical protein
MRILPGARDKLRSREPWRTTTVIEKVTRYTGMEVALFVVGSGICGKDDAYLSGADPYFVCCGTRRRPAFPGYDGQMMKVCQSRTYPTGHGFLILRWARNRAARRSSDPNRSGGSTAGSAWTEPYEKIKAPCRFRRHNDTHASTIHPEARPARRSGGHESNRPVAAAC